MDELAAAHGWSVSVLSMRHGRDATERLGVSSCRQQYGSVRSAPTCFSDDVVRYPIGSLARTPPGPERYLVALIESNGKLAYRSRRIKLRLSKPNSCPRCSLAILAKIRDGVNGASCFAGRDYAISVPQFAVVRCEVEQVPDAKESIVFVEVAVFGQLPIVSVEELLLAELQAKLPYPGEGVFSLELDGVV